MHLHPTPYTVSVTYETWDHEALEAGDTDDRGFELEHEPLESLEQVASVCSNAGVCLPGRNDGTRWLSSVDPEPNYRTGEYTYRAVHVLRRGRSVFDHPRVLEALGRLIR